jgi:hypothetical protein
MTCDSNRPCKRCIQRGLDKTCEDAPRKRKKYLQDVPPTLISHQSSEASNMANSVSTNGMRPNVYEATLFQHSNTVPINFQNGGDLYNMDEKTGARLQKLPLPKKPEREIIPQPRDQFQDERSYADGRLDQLSDRNGLQDIREQGGPNQNDRISFQSNNQPDHRTIQPDNQPDPSYQNQQNYHYLPNKHLHNQQIQYNRKRTNFLSSAADLEYSTLSSILQENFPNHSTSNEGTPSSINISPALSPHAFHSVSQTPRNSYPNELYKQDMNSPYLQSQKASPNDVNRNLTPGHLYDSPRYPKCDESINQYFLGPTDSDHILMFPDIITAIESIKASDPSVYYERNATLTLSFAIGIVPEDNHYTKLGDVLENDTFFKEPEEIYEKVKKPFSYTPGFHSLIAYLRKRFPKPMLVKMAESMAAYRPSFIACTNSLKEGDLIFMEQQFQRTLLTYDNFIRVSGTPTIVWRRTGEIAYVGNEFCLLTGWTKEELLSKTRKFIVELLDDKSVLEYFQLFLRIAFGDFLGATMTECTLLTPNPDVKIRTGCMWTLKRDVFGIPMMIIGNFLPII